jgi:hypothetical protein
MVNEYIDIVLWVVIALVVVGVGFFVGILWLAVHTASRPGFRLQPADPATYGAQFALAAQLNEWATEHGFEWIGGYELRLPIVIGRVRPGHGWAR